MVTPRQVVLCCIRKQTKKPLKCRPVSGVPLQPLLQFWPWLHDRSQTAFGQCLSQQHKANQNSGCVTLLYNPPKEAPILLSYIQHEKLQKGELAVKQETISLTWRRQSQWDIIRALLTLPCAVSGLRAWTWIQTDLTIWAIHSSQTSVSSFAMREQYIPHKVIKTIKWDREQELRFPPVKSDSRTFSFNQCALTLDQNWPTKVNNKIQF